LDLKNILINNKLTKKKICFAFLCFAFLCFAFSALLCFHSSFYLTKMSDVFDFCWDLDNTRNVFLTEGQSVHIDENIDQNGRRTFVVEFTFDTCVLILEQTGHDENLDHVFLIKFFQDGELKCTFWGLLEMETDENQKRFTVTSQDMHTCDRSTTDGIDALRQILPEERICQNVLSAIDAGYDEDDEEAIDPASNLGDRFADVADDPSADDPSDEDASDDDPSADDPSEDEELEQD
jgi:hypothetical protein